MRLSKFVINLTLIMFWSFMVVSVTTVEMISTNSYGWLESVVAYIHTLSKKITWEGMDTESTIKSFQP